MKNYIILFLSLIFFNLTLYLALEINKHFFYLLASFLVFYNFCILQILSRESVNKKNENIKKEFDSSADEHPIIKAARERLGK